MSISAGSASELIYTPINPSFGGNPFNSAHLLGTADRQNDFTDPASRSTGVSALRTQNTVADQFVRQLQSRLLSSLAREVTDAIFGDQPQDEGTIVFGDQTITFARGLESISLVIDDAAAGTTTAIEVPTLLVETP